MRTITDDHRVFPEADENDALVEKVMAAKKEWKQSKRELEAMMDRVKGLGERIAPGGIPRACNAMEKTVANVWQHMRIS